MNSSLTLSIVSRFCANSLEKRRVESFKKCVKANVENCKHWETAMLNCVGCINIDMSTLNSHFESLGTLWSYLLIFSGRSI